MKRPEVERMRALLVEAITTLCRSGLPYSDNLKVEGLIGITLDEADIILVNLNKTFGSGLGGVSSPEKSQRSLDKSVLSEEENSQDSIGETSSSERLRKSSPKKRRDSTQAHDSKRARLTPTKDAEPEQNIHITNTYSIKSPESQGGGAEKKEIDPEDGELSASSESALTTANRNISDSNTPSQPENSNNQDSHADTAMDRTGPIVKIEIDSDPEVEEIKIEPGLASQSCSRVPPLPHQTHGAIPETSLHNTFAPDITQTIQAISTSDLQGELFTSQLPPEFSSGTQSDPNAVPIGMFSNTLTQPVAGPSGLNISQVTGSPYTQGDPTKARPVPGGIVQHKTKLLDLRGESSGTDFSSAVMRSFIDAPTQGIGTQHCCKFCGKSFRSQSGRICHEKAHEGKFRHVCHICQKGFMNGNNLKKHLNSHENRKEYTCSVCNKGFNCQYNRNAHQLRCRGAAKYMLRPPSETLDQPLSVSVTTGLTDSVPGAISSSSRQTVVPLVSPGDLSNASDTTGHLPSSP